MAVDAFSFAGMYSHALDSAAHLLVKGVEYASANSVAEEELRGWRLIDDM